MRPGQNKRMRGRPNGGNSRRGPNPLTRSYESNGPDIKIRGNAHHVAEKYLQLARDAHTGGDPVAAENYLQHAEHYFRLIASAQAAQLAAQNGRPPGEGEDDIDDEDDIGGPPDRFASPIDRSAPAPLAQPVYAPGQIQPPQNVAPASAPAPVNENAQSERSNYSRQDRNSNNRQQDRSPRADRNIQDRGDGQSDFRAQRDGKPREYRNYRDNSAPNGREQQPAIDPSAAPASLPSFITTAPRLNGGEAAPEGQIVETQKGLPDAPFEGIEPDDSSQEGRGRRRRLRTPFGYNRPGDMSDKALRAEPEEKSDPAGD